MYDAVHRRDRSLVRRAHARAVVADHHLLRRPVGGRRHRTGTPVVARLYVPHEWWFKGPARRRCSAAAATTSRTEARRRARGAAGDVRASCARWCTTQAAGGREGWLQAARGIGGARNARRLAELGSRSCAARCAGVLVNAGSARRWSTARDDLGGRDDRGGRGGHGIDHSGSHTIGVLSRIALAGGHARTRGRCCAPGRSDASGPSAPQTHECRGEARALRLRRGVLRRRGGPSRRPPRRGIPRRPSRLEVSHTHTQVEHTRAAASTASASARRAATDRAGPTPNGGWARTERRPMSSSAWACARSLGRSCGHASGRAAVAAAAAARLLCYLTDAAGDDPQAPRPAPPSAPTALPPCRLSHTEIAAPGSPSPRRRAQSASARLGQLWMGVVARRSVHAGAIDLALAALRGFRLRSGTPSFPSCLRGSHPRSAARQSGPAGAFIAGV